jgi:hypothetical protein
MKGYINRYRHILKKGLADLEREKEQFEARKQSFEKERDTVIKESNAYMDRLDERVRLLKAAREEFEIEKQSLAEIHIKNLEELNVKMLSFLSGDS